MKVYKVGQISAYIKNLLTQDYLLKKVCVEGEVVDINYHSSGHVYFTLKDETGSMQVVMFKSDVAKGLSVRLEDGQKVVVTGSVTLYGRKNECEILAKKVEQQGLGEQYVEFLKLKQRLAEEGLFDFEHKKPIPKYATRVGIISSTTAKGLGDIRAKAKSRNPYVQLVLYPTLVQGAQAAQSIVNGIAYMDKQGFDTLIVGRGGGASDDINDVFNDERVVRAIYEAKTPIITGTGHDYNLTLCDYVADERAITPTEACELALFDVVGSLERLREQKLRMRLLTQGKYRMAYARYESGKNRLEKNSPAGNCRREKERLAEARKRLAENQRRLFERKKHQYELYATRLQGLSPLAKLVGGFGYVEAQDKPLTDIDAVKVGDTLRVTVKQGQIMARVTEVSKQKDGQEF